MGAKGCSLNRLLVFLGAGLRFGTEGSQAARGLPDEAPTRLATPRLMRAKRPFFFFFGSSGFLTSSEPRSELPSLIVPRGVGSKRTPRGVRGGVRGGFLWGSGGGDVSVLDYLGRREQIARDYTQAELTDAERAMLDYAVKLTKTPGEMNVADVERLRTVGFDDAAIHAIAQVTAYFNYINRIADGLGVDLEESMKEAADA